MASPRVPRPGSRRGEIIATQRADDARGRFRDRTFNFSLGLVPPGATVTETFPVPSLGGSHVRLVALRGVLTGTTGPFLVGLEMAQLFLRLALNGQSDFVADGIGDNVASFAMLFDDPNDPWFWFHAPARLRTGDLIGVSVTNVLSGEGAPSLGADVSLRLLDDETWTELYAQGLALEVG